MKYIINFHGLGEPKRTLERGEDRYWLSKSGFEAILDAVAAYRSPSSLQLAITFDDGNCSDFFIALPKLLTLNLKATFFIITDRLDQQGSLTSNQLREMLQLGMTIGSHGCQHLNWAQTHPRMLDEDLRSSRKQLEDLLGTNVNKIAIPFGAYNRTVLKCLIEAGYEKVYSSDGGVAYDHRWFQPRNCITTQQTYDEIKCNARASSAPPQRLMNEMRLIKRYWLNSSRSTYNAARTIPGTLHF